MTTAPQPDAKRRRFRWSLRTMFVLLTVAACWFGYHVNWIRQRQALLAEQRTLSALYPNHGWASYVPGQPPSAPGLLWLFGEAGLPALSLIIVADEHLDQDAELRQARALFPEAQVACTVVKTPAASPRQTAASLDNGDSQ